MSGIPIPPLPPYLSLLLTGALSAPWPLYVSLAHLEARAAEHRSRPKTLLFTSSNEAAFQQELEAHNDAWMNEHCMSGSWSYLLDAIQVFYPTSPRDLRLLLSLVRPFPHGATVQPSSPANVFIDGAPTMIVLHELSAWFTSDSESENHSLSDYLRLVTMALDLAKYLSTAYPRLPPMRLVVVDRGLLGLRLPAVVSRATSSGPQTRSSSEEPRGRKQESVLEVTAKYFDWVGVVESIEDPSSAAVTDPPNDRPQTHTLKLRRATALSGLTVDGIATHTWCWREERGGGHGTRMFNTILPLW